MVPLLGRKTQAARTLRRHSSDLLERRNFSFADSADESREGRSNAPTALDQPWSWLNGSTLPESLSEGQTGNSSIPVCGGLSFHPPLAPRRLPTRSDIFRHPIA